MSDTKGKRIIYLDYLRIIATVAIIILHVAAENFYKRPVTSYEWNVFNFFDGIVRWGVPMFAMISGALFLDNSKPIKIKSLYTKNIVRIITAFAFWSLVYAIFSPDERLYWDGMSKLRYIAKNFVTGHFHMWFLFMIVGMYIIVPILRKITESEKITEYFLIVSFLFTFLIPAILKIPALSYISKIYGKVTFHFTLGYSSYFVLGYYLMKKDFSKLWRYVIYVLGILGFAVTVILTAVLSWQGKRVVTDYTYEYFTINVLLEAVAVFVFAKYRMQKIEIDEKERRRVFRLSKYSFGVYLIHLLVIEKLEVYGMQTLMFDPIIAVPLKIVIVLVLSTIVSAILNHIPILKKYIV